VGNVRSADCNDSSSLSIKIMDLAVVPKLVGPSRARLETGKIIIAYPLRKC